MGSGKLTRTIFKVVLLGTLLSLSMQVAVISPVHAGTRTGPINSGIVWLQTHQSSDGSYGSLTELQTVPAANALWVRNSSSPSVSKAYNWLKNQLQNSTSWFWSSSFGEADVPGEVLYSFHASMHLGNLDVSTVSSRLLSFQQSDGGFKGYFDPTLGHQVTSSVDTGMALWGLINAGAITSSSQQAAVNYLFSLQNPDGSFNLTRTIKSDPLYSLGPDPISITALLVLVLKDASLILSDSHVSSSLNFLNKAAGANFNGHVYAASLSALAFTQFHQTTEASGSLSFILSQQNMDGGFRDIARSSTGSNALDTGWGTLALELGGLFGDVNLDGIVNISDLSLVGVSFGSTIGASGWKPHADVDGNGVVNIVDLVLVANDFGKTADSL